MYTEQENYLEEQKIVFEDHQTLNIKHQKQIYQQHNKNQSHLSNTFITFECDSVDFKHQNKLKKHKRIHKFTKKGIKQKLQKPKLTNFITKEETNYIKKINIDLLNNNVFEQNHQTQTIRTDEMKIEINKPNKQQFLFPQCVNRANNIFYGYFGHSTVLINQPIIEGAYYLQVTILDPTHPNHPKGKQFQSSVRIGLCKNNQNLLVPLGGQNSYCYKSKDGSLLHFSKRIQQITGQAYNSGDTIGIYLYMSPPYRYMKDNNTQNISNAGSRLIFYKNGNISCELNNIDQCFYNIGISLFNWANVNINLGPTFKYKIQQDYKPIMKVFEEKFSYSMN